MINPSDKNYKNNENAKYPDATIENLYKILEHTKNFSSFEVINLYSEISTKPKKTKGLIKDDLNDYIVTYVIKKAETIIPAWGIGTKFKEQINKKILPIIRGTKKAKIQIVVNHYPSHFAPYCTSVNRNPVFENLEIDELERFVK